MGPEKNVQLKCNTLLKTSGFIVLRHGQDGYPDVLAVHPSGKGKGWLPGRPVPGALHLKWSGATRSNNRVMKYGINLFPGLRHTKLFIEYKEPGGGTLNPRQKVILERLQSAGTAAVITSENELEQLLSSSNNSSS